MKWIGQHIVDLVAKFRGAVDFSEDVTFYQPINDANPTISIGSSVTDRFEIQANYNSSAQTLDGVELKTYTTSGTAQDGRIQFIIDELPIGNFNDDGLFLNASKGLTIGSGNAIISDSSGTTTLSNIDSIDSTTVSTLDSALVQGGLAEAVAANTTKVTNVTTNLTATTHASQITINSSDGTNVIVAEASGSIAGVMSVTHHDKLDGIETSATADQSKSDIDGLGITTVGTIDTGVWQGTAVASAYLDADTMHYSAQRQLTHHTFQDVIWVSGAAATQVVYISLTEIDAENTNAANFKLPLTAPVAGKLLKAFIRTSHDLSDADLTLKLYTRSVSQTSNGAPAEIGAITATGPTNKTMTTFDFTGTLDGDTGTNAVVAGDKVQISIEASADETPNSNFFLTLMWEWDLS